jgi:hypothetical protein
MTSLRLIVLAATGQDVRQCWCCGLCSAAIGAGEAGSLEQWVQWLIADDERALTHLPQYNEPALREAQRLCANRLDFLKALAALQAEAKRRGLKESALIPRG